MESVQLLFKKSSQKKKKLFYFVFNLSFYLTLTWGFYDKMKNMIFDKYAKKLIPILPYSFFNSHTIIIRLCVQTSIILDTLKNF